MKAPISMEIMITLIKCALLAITVDLFVLMISIFTLYLGNKVYMVVLTEFWV